MPSRANQLPKDAKAGAAPTTTRRLLPIVALVAAVLLIAAGIVLARCQHAAAGRGPHAD